MHFLFVVPVEIDDSVATLASANNTSNSSQDNSDDFVLVPNNLPIDPCSGNYDKRLVLNYLAQIDW